MSLHAALERVVELKTESLRYSLMRCFERATRWENRPSIREPGAYPSIRRRFQPLFDQLRNAGTPQATLQLAVETLEVIRVTFREYEQIYREELQGAHRGSLLLGGLYD